MKILEIFSGISSNSTVMSSMMAKPSDDGNCTNWFMPNATESFAGSCDWLALVRCCAGAEASSRAAEAVCKYRLPLTLLRATGARESEPSELCA